MVHPFLGHKGHLYDLFFFFFLKKDNMLKFLTQRIRVSRIKTKV